MQKIIADVDINNGWERGACQLVPVPGTEHLQQMCLCSVQWDPPLFISDLVY